MNLAGQESKLNPLTAKRPIAALPFGCRYRIIDFMLSSVSQARIDSVALFIEESGRSIYDHIRSGREWDLDGTIKGGIFTYSQQRRKLADYLTNKPNESFYENQRLYIKRAYADVVVIMEGDVVQNLDLESICQYHVDHAADITVVYKSMIHQEAKNNNIEHVYEMDDVGYLKEVHLLDAYDKERVAVDTHAYVINTNTLLELFDKAEAEGFYVDLGALIRENLCQHKVSAFEYTGYVAFINSVKAYYDANMSMLTPPNFNALFYGSNAIITRSKSGVPTYYDTKAVVKNSQFATGCLVSGTVENSVVSRKAIIASGAYVAHSILHSGVQIGENAIVEYAVLDKGAKIESGAVVRGTKDNPVIIEKEAYVSKGEHA